VCFILNERAIFDPLCCLRLLHFRCGQNFFVLFVLSCLIVDPIITALTTDLNCSEHVGCTPLLPLQIIHVPLPFQYLQGISQKVFSEIQGRTAYDLSSSSSNCGHHVLLATEDTKIFSLK